MGLSPRIDLSVVVAATDADRTLEASVSALAASCAGLSAEIIVVGDWASAGADLAVRHPNVVLQTAAAGALVPELWAAGIEQAR
jgi:hypothetical protein